MSRFMKPGIFVLCLLPLAWLFGRFWQDALGVNPIETINRYLGDWALRFLLITLAVTPVRQLCGWAWLPRLRRMLGLFAFFYVCLHMASYIGLDLFFDWNTLWKDILKRRYITLGMICFLLLLPLAITSTDAMIRRLGGKRWKKLHQLVYPAGCLAVVHFWMMVKADIREPALYALILALLLGWRVVRAFRQSAARVIMER